MNSIKFYKVNDEYGSFSNFAPYSIFIESQVWLTTEHYFQASKFNDNNIKEKIRSLKSPMQAAEEGRKKQNPIRQDWEEVKLDVMRKAIRSKFFQHHELKLTLVRTNDKVIIEHTSNDNYWADGGDGKGQNMLGKLLMELRTELLSIQSEQEWVLPPWLAFPEVSPIDMFWRMGLGEQYMYVWIKWFGQQSLNIQEIYMKNFPAKSEWENFYEE
jgi:N-glycosidase YbiA